VGWLVALSAGWLALSTGARAYLQARDARAQERAASERDAREERLEKEP
jgi:hypothetical protein